METTQVELYQDLSVPVLAFDGPAGVGKGTTRAQVAKSLGYHELDSGCLYRAVAMRSLLFGIKPDDVPALVELASSLNVRTVGMTVYWGDLDVTVNIRSEEVSNHARIISPIPELRRALLEYQLSMRKAPGLVPDGRDMGEIYKGPLVFRYYFTTSLKVKALRRFRWLESQDQKPVFSKVMADMEARDKADMNRLTSPLRPHPEAVVVDNTNMKIGEAAELILADYRMRSAKVR